MNGIKTIITIVGIGLLLKIIFKKKKPANMLFIGDSLTAYSNSYANQLRKQYPDINIKVIAKSGEQTGWMLNQLQQNLNTKYDDIVIWGGVNDIYAKQSITQAKNNLQKMYDLAKMAGSRLITFTTIPTATYKLSTAKTTQLTNELNKWIKNNVTPDVVIDVNQLVNNGTNGTKKEYLQNDTLHLTDLAHNLILKNLLPKV